MSRPRVLVAEPDDLSERALAVLRVHADVELRACGASELPDAFARFDALWIKLGLRITADAMGPSPRCRFIAIPATGTDHVDVAACAARGITVLSLRGEGDRLRHVTATAEHTIALVLLLVRHLPAALRSVERGEFDRNPFRGHELQGMTAGLVGYGRLGRLVAKYLRAFDVRVLAYDPHARFDTDDVTRVDALGRLLEESDIVSLHVVYDERTHGMIGAPELARMRPGAVLVNTARGGVVDEVALVEALRAGRIAGAAVDVVWGEPGPSPATSPLLAARHDLGDRLVITPHIGGNTWESLGKAEAIVAEKLVAALSGTATAGKKID